jgi:hypothetical protein
MSTRTMSLMTLFFILGGLAVYLSDARRALGGGRPLAGGERCRLCCPRLRHSGRFSPCDRRVAFASKATTLRLQARRPAQSFVPGPDYRRPLRDSTLRAGDVAGFSSMTSTLSRLHGFVERGVNGDLPKAGWAVAIAATGHRVHIAGERLSGNGKKQWKNGAACPARRGPLAGRDVYRRRFTSATLSL